MKNSRVAVALVAATFALGAAGCVSKQTGKAAGQVAPANVPVSLEVTNRNFYDMTIYVVNDGVATRVGTVTANRTQSIRLDPSLYSSAQLQIVATPVGAGGRASSGNLIVRPGDTIEFRIAPTLNQSSVVVR